MASSELVRVSGLRNLPDHPEEIQEISRDVVLRAFRVALDFTNYKILQNMLPQLDQLGGFFRQAGTLRRLIIQKAGYLCKPQGKLTLTLSTNNTVASQIRYFLSKLLATA